jgi:hypothetical protein
MHREVRTIRAHGVSWPGGGQLPGCHAGQPHVRRWKGDYSPPFLWFALYRYGAISDHTSIYCV